jgi:hypothetical protein
MCFRNLSSSHVTEWNSISQPWRQNTNSHRWESLKFYNKISEHENRSPVMKVVGSYFTDWTMQSQCVCVCVCVCQNWRRSQLESRLLFHELNLQHVPVPRLFRPAIIVESISVCTWITSTSFNLRRFITTNKVIRWYICLIKHWNLKDLTRRYLQIIFMFEADRIFNVRHKKHTGHFTRLCYKHLTFYLTVLHITAISKGTLSIVVMELGSIWQVITGNKQYRLSSVVSHLTYPLGVTCYR